MRIGQKGTVYVAVGLAAVGFIVIFLGWNGAAGKDFAQGQVPYVISGGITGLALVAVGLTLVLVETRRRDNARVLEKLDRVLDALGAGPPAKLPLAPAGELEEPATVAGRPVRTRTRRPARARRSA